MTITTKRTQKHLWENPEIVYTIYKKYNSAKKVAVELKCSHNTILRILSYYKYKILPLGKYPNRTKLKAWGNKEKIKDLYIKGEPSTVLAKMFDCNYRTILYILKKEGIKIRHNNIENLGKYADGIPISDTIKEKIRASILKNGIHKGINNPFYGKKHTKKSLFKMSGKFNPSWNGGSSFEPYDAGFTKKFKMAIRMRDNQICMNCRIHRENLKYPLSVHHINYDKKLSILQNCISLCRNCHGLTIINREYWTKLFQDKLQKLYDYKYKSNNVIINIGEQENGHI